jgi:hypothetical protein
MTTSLHMGEAKTISLQENPYTAVNLSHTRELLQTLTGANDR